MTGAGRGPEPTIAPAALAELRRGILRSGGAAIVTSAAGWAVSGTQAQVAAPSVQIEALKIMTSAKLPPERFTDYSVIFN